MGFFKRFHGFFSFQQLFWKWTFQYGTPWILTLACLSVVKISSWPRWWMKSVWLEQCKCLLSINYLLLLSPIMGQNYFWSSNYIWSGCFFWNTYTYIDDIVIWWKFYIYCFSTLLCSQNQTSAWGCQLQIKMSFLGLVDKNTSYIFWAKIFMNHWYLVKTQVP